MAKNTLEEARPRKYSTIFVNDDGVIDTWIYDLDKNPYGPIETNFSYPKNYNLVSETQKDNKVDKKYLNPYNGKYVSYQRYHQLVKEGKIIP